MKKLIIYQEKCEPIVLFDNDDRSNEDYIKETDEAFHSQVITTLHTTDGSVSIRPGKLVSILVQDALQEPMDDLEVPEIKSPETEKPKKKTTRKPKKKADEKKEEEIDIIKDVD